MANYNSSPKQLLTLRMAGLFGVLSPIIAFTCIGIAIFHAPWFSWTMNWLSDLGGLPGETPIWAARGTASIVFNIGLIIAGILGILFVIGFIKSKMLGPRFGLISSLVLILDMVALSAIGIFPETTGSYHVAASTTFFFLVPIALFLVGIKIRKTSEKNLGLLMILLGVLSLSSLPFLFIPPPIGSNAVIEMFPAVTISIFAAIYGIKLFRLRELIEAVDVIGNADA